MGMTGYSSSLARSVNKLTSDSTQTVREIYFMYHKDRVPEPDLPLVSNAHCFCLVFVQEIIMNGYSSVDSFGASHDHNVHIYRRIACNIDTRNICLLAAIGDSGPFAG